MASPKSNVTISGSYGGIARMPASGPYLGMAPPGVLRS